MIQRGLDEIDQAYYKALEISGATIFLIDTPDTIKWKILKILYVFVVSLIFGSFVTMHLIFMNTSHDFDLIMTNLGILINIMTNCLKLSRLIVKRKLFKNFILDFSSFNSNLHRPNYSSNILSGAYESCNKVRLVWFTFMFFNLGMWYIAPVIGAKSLIPLLTGRGTYEEFAQDIPSTYTVHLNSPLKEIRYVYELIHGYTIIVFWMTFDAAYFVSVYMISTQYDILGESLQKNAKKQDGDAKEAMDISKVVQDHMKLIKAARSLKKMLSPVLASLLLNSGVVIGCAISRIVLNPRDGNMSVIVFYLKFISYVMLYLLELLLFCWLSYMVNEANRRFSYALYYSYWHESLNKKQGRDIVLSILISQQDLSFTALGMVKVNLGTFLDVLRIAYSYFTFMKQVVVMQ